MTPAELYLDLLKRVLTRDLSIDESPADEFRILRALNWKRHLIEPAQRLLGSRGYVIAKPLETRATRRERRRAGADWPNEAETMVGFDRLDNIADLVRVIVSEDIPGDLIECGVWRGGASIYMRAALAAYEEPDRTVWVADSFEGVPPPDVGSFPADEGVNLFFHDQLAVSLEEVQANFARYGFLDERTRFLKGWFRDTLLAAPVQRLSLLRLDGDLYQSTWEALTALYPKLSRNGFVIIDDYGSIEACRQAVHDYRDQEQISDRIVRIDHAGVYWQRT